MSETASEMSSLDAADARRALADIEVVTARVRQSRTYMLASAAMMLWGPIIAAGYALTQFLPRYAPIIWPACHITGLALTFALARRERRTHGRTFELRILYSLLIMVGFGLVWSVVLGHFGPREMSAFWATLFMFAYVVTGLWFGRAFVVLGLSIAALTLAGYAWAGPWFNLYMAVVNGGGLLLCGFWMRRA